MRVTLDCDRLSERRVCSNFRRSNSRPQRRRWNIIGAVGRDGNEGALPFLRWCILLPGLKTNDFIRDTSMTAGPPTTGSPNIYITLHLFTEPDLGNIMSTSSPARPSGL